MKNHHFLLLVHLLAAVAALVVSGEASSLRRNALFSEPLQVLFDGQNLTDGHGLTLSLVSDGSLVAHVDYSAEYFLLRPSAYATRRSALFVDIHGVLIVVFDDETIPVSYIGEHGREGRYALLLVEGKVEVFGPDSWSSGVNYLSGVVHEAPPPASVKYYFLYGGGTIEGSRNGDVVLAANGRFTAVLRPSCTIAVLLDGSVKVWENNVLYILKGGCKLVLTSLGQLILQDNFLGIPIPLWSSTIIGNFPGTYTVVLRYDGELVIYAHRSTLYDRSLHGGAEKIAGVHGTSLSNSQMKIAGVNVTFVDGLRSSI